MAEAIAVAITGELITYILEKLIEKAIPYFLGDSVAEKLEILSTEMLPKLNVVISAADQSSVELKKQLEPWLRKLKHAVHEAEDLLDELQYDLLEKQLTNQSVGQQVSLFPLHSISRALGLSFRPKNGLRRSLEKLEQIAARADGFIKLMQLQNDVKSSIKSVRTTAMPWIDMNHQPTVSSLTSAVFGRDEERDRLIDMLTSPGASNVESCHPSVHSQVIAVYGIGGAGKTTLAQHIYHNDKVTEHFNLRMWIHVTRNFDIFTVTRQIIESATKGECPEMSNLDALQEMLKHVLKDKKFLLVLDDIWIDDWSTRDSWDKLLIPVKVGDSASMILVTTRTERTASVIGARHVFPLRDLSYEECWSIVDHYAFGGSKNIRHDVEFLDVGKQIVQKLRHSPLAAKMVGIQLSSKMDIDSWKMILRSDILKDTMDILMWSYKHLPPYLQRCFSYCSIFPKGWRFKIDNLVFLWMAQGFIHIPDNSDLTVEEIGRKYFDYLLSSSFFQHDGFENYVVHDLLHDLAERVSVEDCFRIEGDHPVKIPHTILHISINTSDLAVHIPSICKLTNLRTFFKFGITHSLFDYTRVMLEKLKRLRVLHFYYRVMYRFPNCLGHLKHLRYLAYHYELPKSLCKLYQLQVIQGHLFETIKLPDEARNLINLRHVLPRINSESPNIGKRTSLQNLEYFLVDKTNGRGIEQLRDLFELRGVLWIKNLENVEDRAEAEKAKLKNKIHLDGLVLVWGSSEQDGGLDKDSEVLEGLEPSHSLELLSIRQYKGIKCPSWMKCISNLVILHLSECTKLESLPALGQLPLLTKLHISNATAIKEISPQFYGNCSISAFPRLKYFLLENMKNLKHWYGTDGVLLFPHLDELRIVDCPNLLDVIPLPQSLRLVDIINCPKLASLIPKALSQQSENVNNGKEIVFTDVYTDDDYYCNIMYTCLFSCIFLEYPYYTSEYYPIPLWDKRTLMEMKKIRNDDGRADQQGNEGINMLSHSPLDSFRVIYSSVSEIAFLSRPVTFASLSMLIIRKCPLISSLSLGHLMVLQTLDVSYCKNLTTIYGLQDRESLRELSVQGCPHLKYRIGDGNCKDLFPSSLQSLVVGDCGDLIRLLPNCVTRLTLLSTFVITRCTQLSSLLFLRSLPSLENIGVIGCPRIVTSGGVALKSIKGLAIDDITLLKVLLQEESRVSLERLIIVRCPLNTPFSCEQNEMFQCLTSLKELSFIYCDNLPYLPASIEKLSSLEYLRVHCCPRIKSLGNLLSTTRLSLHGCEPGLYDTVKRIPRSST